MKAVSFNRGHLYHILDSETNCLIQGKMIFKFFCGRVRTVTYAEAVARPVEFWLKDMGKVSPGLLCNACKVKREERGCW